MLFLVFSSLSEIMIINPRYFFSTFNYERDTLRYHVIILFFGIGDFGVVVLKQRAGLKTKKVLEWKAINSKNDANGAKIVSKQKCEYVSMPLKMYSARDLPLCGWFRYPTSQAVHMPANHIIGDLFNVEFTKDKSFKKF